MGKALEYFLKRHNIPQSVILVESSIEKGYDENIVIHHKQDLSLLYSIRINNIIHDDIFLLHYITSRELSRCFRVLELFQQSGNKEGVDLLIQDINFLNLIQYGETRFTDEHGLEPNLECGKLQPERVVGEQERDRKGIIPQRKSETVFQLHLL